ncbi:MAG: hypothetical protein ACI8W7_000067 [Gammaproteobacteria bacterium]|jgi:hypothetical protein
MGRQYRPTSTLRHATNDIGAIFTARTGSAVVRLCQHGLAEVKVTGNERFIKTCFRDKVCFEREQPTASSKGVTIIRATIRRGDETSAHHCGHSGG